MIEDGTQGVIHITLKYWATRRRSFPVCAASPSPACVSTPALTELPKVLQGLGIAIISTSKGVMTDKAGPRSSCRRRSPGVCMVRR
ncbi:MAG: 30S ribosomal protein S8 [Oscillospiraceae bacterium]